MPLHELHLNPSGEIVLDNLSTAPATTTDKLYNVGGDLFFDGFQLNTSVVNNGTVIDNTLRWDGSQWVESTDFTISTTQIDVNYVSGTEAANVFFTAEESQIGNTGSGSISASVLATTSTAILSSPFVLTQVNDGTNSSSFTVNGTGSSFSNQIRIGGLNLGSGATVGMIRWNGTNFQGYDGTAWNNFDTGANVDPGTVTNNTLRWDGNSWVESNLITNDGVDEVVISMTVATDTSSITTIPTSTVITGTDGTGTSTLTVNNDGTMTLVGNDGTNTFTTTLLGTNTLFGNQIQVGTLNGGATAANGMIRLNSTDIEGYADGSWQSLTYGDEDARQAIQIGASSTAYLTYDNLTGDLDVTALAITSVDVDTTTYVDFNAFITANYTGSEYQEGDVVILTDVSSEQRTYIHNGGSAGTAADFTLLEAPNLTDAYIRGLFTAGSQLAYNATTGEFSVDQASFRVPVLGTATNQTLRWDGTDWQDTSVLLLDDSAGSELSTFTGKILVGTSTATDSAGQIRWNGSNFQGYDGTNWNNFDTGSTVNAGTAANNTLRWDGSEWVESNNITNNGTDTIALDGTSGANSGTVDISATALNLGVTDGTATSSVDLTSTSTVLSGNDGTNTNSLTITGTESTFTNQIEVGGLNAGATAAAGMIRWDGANFQGYDGAAWNNFDTGATVNEGTATSNTLRWDDTSSTWVESTNLTNDDTTVTVAGEFVHQGSLTHSTTSVTTGTTTLTSSDYLILCDTTGGDITLNLPAGATLGTGFVYVIKDTGNASGANDITIDPNASETIEGQATVSMKTAYDTIKLVWSGSEWLTIV